jgi:hypothetical protein
MNMPVWKGRRNPPRSGLSMSLERLRLVIVRILRHELFASKVGASQGLLRPAKHQPLDLDELPVVQAGVRLILPTIFTGKMGR